MSMDILFSEEERNRLRIMVRKGKEKTRVVNRARILLKLEQRQDDKTIAQDVFTSTKTIYRIRVRYADGGIDRALYDLPRSGQPPIITKKVEAYLVATACSEPPKGRARWTLELLRDELIANKKVTRISSVAILKHLQKRGIKPWREKNVVHSKTQ